MPDDFNVNPQDPELNKPRYESLVNNTYELIISEMPTLFTPNATPDNPDPNTCINVKYVVSDHPNNTLYDSIWLTSKASWRIADWLNALGRGEAVSSTYLKSEEFRKSLINMHLQADLGNQETVGKSGGIILVNEITSYVHANNKPAPKFPGTRTVTSVSQKAQQLKAMQAAQTSATGGSAVPTDTPLSPEEAGKAMAF